MQRNADQALSKNGLCGGFCWIINFFQYYFDHESEQN